MNLETALSSTPRKTVVKPILRLSIPPPQQQTVHTLPSRKFSAANVANNLPTNNVIPSVASDAKGSDVEKIVASERLSSPVSKFRSDAGSAGSNGSATKSLDQAPLFEVDSDSNNNPNALPSYKAFESDFRKRIDELNAASRLDMNLRGKKKKSALFRFVCEFFFPVFFCPLRLRTKRQKKHH